MGSMSLAEYLDALIIAFRHHYDTMNEEEKSVAQLNMTLAKPCQIEFFSFKRGGEFMIITLDAAKPDELRIHENIKEDTALFLKSKLDAFKTSAHTRGDLSKVLVKDGKVEGGTWAALEENASVYSFGDLQKEHPDPTKYAEEIFENLRETAQRMLERRKRITEYGTIEQQIHAIRNDIKRIEDSSLKASMLESAKKIDEAISSIRTLEVHEQRLSQMEQEIGGVRKMIGTTKEYQDFRVLATDVDDLKKSHVGKDIFESEIKRLDQRIDGLKEIRFWSKKTAVDVILAVIATASTIIAALLAAHII